MDLLRSGAASRPGRDERDVQRDVARWVWDFTVGGIGPGGGRKLMDGELVSAAAALRAAPGEPALAPYQRLAVHASGDQAAVAVLLAAGTVDAVLERRRGLAQGVDGVHLARRQLVGWLEAHARMAHPAATLAALDEGLGHLAVHLEGLDLDCIDVRPGPVEGPSWSEGLLFPDAGLRSRQVAGRVLLVDDLVPRPRQCPSLRLRDPEGLREARDAPGVQRARLRSVLKEAGIGIVLCRKAPDEEAAADLVRDGIFVTGHVERSMAQRVAMATGCTAVPHAFAFAGDDLGEAEMVRQPRLRMWRLTGAGRLATIEVPGGPMEGARVAAAEKWLRAVAPVMDDPRVLPGGGVWQREAAAAVRAVADHAPGAAPLGMQAVARTLDRIADAVVRNTGRDPLRQRSLEPIDDAMACVRPAVAAALEAAIQVLRVDGRHSRRASCPADLRGGTGPSGSPRGMPGDVPPLM